MIDDFLLRALLAGLGLALVAGPVGCFVVWRRMAYFGDATAHAAIFGVALALVLSVATVVGVLLAAIGMALAVSASSERRLAGDTLLGVAAHGSLAVGLVALSLTARPGFDVESILFGEILAVGLSDLAIIWGGALVVNLVLIRRWRALVMTTLSPDLAVASGVDPRRERLILALMIAAVVAVALKVVGALLVTAMLIIPAAAARSFARNPEAMAVGAAATGCAAAVSGLSGAFLFDTPAGPSIVVAAVVLFGVAGAIGALRSG